MYQNAGRDIITLLLGSTYVFTSLQFGFRENYSTTLAVTHLFEYIRKENDQNRAVCAIFMDLAKAFGSVNHKLLFKL